MTLLSLFLELFSVLGSVASVVSLALDTRPTGTPFTPRESFCFSLAGVLIASFGLMRLREYITRRPKSYKDKKDIRDYMYRWISRGERVAIFSRDMSWVNDDEMKKLLRDKAEKRELILCLPRAIELSSTLGRLGAEVHLYPELEFTPSARFTIINVGRHDSQVAIGRRIGEVHTIQEAASGHDPLFAVAEDLVSVISRLDKCREISPQETQTGV